MKVYLTLKYLDRVCGATARAPPWLRERDLVESSPRHRIHRNASFFSKHSFAPYFSRPFPFLPFFFYTPPSPRYPSLSGTPSASLSSNHSAPTRKQCNIPCCCVLDWGCHSAFACCRETRSENEGEGGGTHVEDDEEEAMLAQGKAWMCS